MTFVCQHPGDFIESVRVRRIFAQAHQKDGIFLSNAKVHSFLKRRFFFSNEIVVTDDVVYFHLRSIAERRSDCAMLEDRQSVVLPPAQVRKFELRAADSNFDHFGSRLVGDR